MKDTEQNVKFRGIPMEFDSCPNNVRTYTALRQNLTAMALMYGYLMMKQNLH